MPSRVRAPGFQGKWADGDRTDFVTLDSGDRVVLQRYRSRDDAIQDIVAGRLRSELS